MDKPVIHLLSVAGSDRKLPNHLGMKSIRTVINWTQRIVGTQYRVAANAHLMNARVDDRRGGRRDDLRRAREIQTVLADDRVCAVVSVRGGSWLTRVLPHVDFDVLKRRRHVLHLFGFSELTTLVNITSRFRKVRAYYDFGPAYLYYALRDHAAAHFKKLSPKPGKMSPDIFARRWAEARFKPEFARFLKDIVNIVTNCKSDRPFRGRLVRGAIESGEKIAIVGGCLSLVTTLLGTPHDKCLRAKNRWLALEDINEDVYRIDRYFAHLKCAGVLKNCAGLLLGDFHHDGHDQTDAVLELLKYHLPGKIPVVASCNFGHCFPNAPIPINQTLVMIRKNRSASSPVELHWPVPRVE